MNAKEYGSEKYNTIIEELRKDINDAKASLKTVGEEAKTKINSLILKFGEYSEQSDKNYPYIRVD